MADGIKYCRQCGKQLNKDAKFCRYCGYRFEAAQEVKAAVNLCPQCGNENAAGAKFCRYCGAGLTEAKATTTVRHGKSNTTGSATNPQIPELKMPAASEPGEFDYGDIDLKSIAEGAAGKAASAAMAEAPGIEILSPVKVLGRSIGGFLKGIINLIRYPKSAIVPLIFAVLWIVLAFLRGSDLLPVRVLNWLTFAEGGLDRGPAGMIGGLAGKGAVAVMLSSLFSGGIPNTIKGAAGIFKKSDDKKSIPLFIAGFLLGGLGYLAFAGFDNVSATTSMAGIAGAVLALQAVGQKDGWIYRIAQSLTAKKINGIRSSQDGKISSLLGGVALGFAIVTSIFIA